MLDLKEMQFEILPGPEAAGGAGFTFGFGRDIAINDGGFNPGDEEWLTQDGVDEMTGVTHFGRDVQAAGTWTWAMHTDAESADEALGLVRTLRGFWGPASRREWSPGQVTALRYRLGGRIRRVYGRPRRFNYPLSNLMLGGNIPVNAEFRLHDTRFYSDEAGTTGPLAWTQTAPSGIILPTTMPLETEARSAGMASMLVGGDTPTPAIITFKGPSVRPEIAVGAWTCLLDDSLGSGDTVIIDTRPWAMTALKNGATSVAGKLSKRQWMQEMTLRPGQVSASYRASSAGAGSYAAVSWRDAWTTM